MPPDKKLHASGEDYLEAVLVLQKEKGMVRSVGVARYMEVSKPSVCHAVATLKDGGFLTMDEDFSLRLTDIGREVAEQTYEKHCFFTRRLIAAGVDPQTAEREACRMEHTISQRSFELLKGAPGIEVVEPPAAKHTLTIPGLELHLRKQTVKWQGQPLHLTHLEFFTLAYLARHPGWIFTQEQIYEAVWHEFPEDCGAAVVNIISQLRRKMGPGNPIRTVPHSGYKFELPSAD